MTALTTERVSAAVAAEIRATLGRQGLTQSELASRLGKNGRWLSVRLSRTASVDMTVDEVAEMAEALGVDAEGFIVAALRACRDSNPKPSDLYPIGAFVKSSLTVDRRGAIGWGLVA